MPASSDNTLSSPELSSMNDEAIKEQLMKMAASHGLDGASLFKIFADSESIDQALSIPPEIIETLYSLAHTWFSLDRAEKALPLFRALCILVNDDADYWIGYGVCLRKIHQFQNAGQAFQTAALLRPAWAIPYFHALELALTEKDWDSAATYLEAYNERADATTPSAVTREAERLKTVLETCHSQHSPQTT